MAKLDYFFRRSQCVKTNISFLFFIEITRMRGFFKVHPLPSLPPSANANTILLYDL